ncbi:MAG: type II secretion system protein [Carnobacterium sp.]
MDAIDGIKQNNQKGYILLESLVAFLIITLCIGFYLPMTASLLIAIKKEKIEVDLVRIAYEQSQKIALGQDIDRNWQTGEIIYDITISETNRKKGILIQYNGREKRMGILSTEIITH